MNKSEQLKSEQLDNAIKELFWRLIKRPDLIVSIDHGSINFKNGLALFAFKKRSDEEVKPNKPLRLNEDTFSYYIQYGWEIVSPDTDKLIFSIRTPHGRTYIVPEITDRHDYAEALNTIDKTLEFFEKIKINEYIEELDNDKLN